MIRLKVARVMQRANYTPWRVARRLKAMLAEPLLVQRARSVAQQLSHEDGVRAAAMRWKELYERTR